MGYYWKLHSLIRNHQVQWGCFIHEVMLCVIFPLSFPSLPQISKWVEFKGIITSINRIFYNLHDGTCSVGDEHLIQWEKSWPGGWCGDADEDAARGGPVSILPFGQSTDECLPFVTYILVYSILTQCMLCMLWDFLCENLILPINNDQYHICGEHHTVCLPV